MKHIDLYKYQGAGNDFIMVDNRDGGFPREDHDLIRRMCDRHFGVGADGLMLLCPSAEYDLDMLYYNADGRPGSMCGNGGRCMAAFARDRGYVRGNGSLHFTAVDGEHVAQFTGDNGVRLKMRDCEEPRRVLNGYFVDSGSPHHVEYVDNLLEMDVDKAGRSLREHKAYAPGGCNVDFVREEKNGSLSLRTFERGVEGETLACGTGAVAAAVVQHARSARKPPYDIHMRGGTLKVYLRKRGGIFTDIWLEGPAEFVFKGEYPI